MRRSSTPSSASSSWERTAARGARPHPPRGGGAPRVPEPVSHADFAVAAQATSAVLAALFHRQRTGEGQHVDVSMAETMLAVMEWTAIEANGGLGDELPTFYPAKAVIVRLGDRSPGQLPA